jgi:glutamate synthase domain-containing protein 3
LEAIDDLGAKCVPCGERLISEVNTEIKSALHRGEREIVVTNPAARHNLAVGVIGKLRIVIDGSAGYYCGGLMDGPDLEVRGSAGWGLAESMMGGTVRVLGNAGNGAAAAIRGGSVVIQGDASARLGVSMKGGTVVVAGDCGYMAGFMGQKGVIIVCGDAGDAFGDSLYATTCYVAGRIRSLGTDAVEAPLEDSDRETLTQHLLSLPEQLRKPADTFRKIIPGKKLWNFDKANWKVWQEAL